MQERVRELLKEALLENPELFLLELDFSLSNKIKVVVDGDKGVPIKECIRISRHIEHNINREEGDFALEVTSPDITRPLTHKRQYRKNIGRILRVKTKDVDLEGILTSVNHSGIELQWKTREQKPIGKGKVTVEKKAEVAFQDIKEVKVKIIF